MVILCNTLALIRIFGLGLRRSPLISYPWFFCFCFRTSDIYFLVMLYFGSTLAPLKGSMLRHFTAVYCVCHTAKHVLNMLIWQRKIDLHVKQFIDFSERFFFSWLVWCLGFSPQEKAFSKFWKTTGCSHICAINGSSKNLKSHVQP